MTEELKPRFFGFAAYFFQIRMAREIIAIFFILVFIQNTLVQIIPLICMSLGIIVLMVARNPYRIFFSFLMNLILEVLYMILFVTLLLLHIYRAKVENEE